MKPESQPPHLTQKQQAFILEYPVDRNAAAAARRAGYSVDTAREIGHENLTKPHIRAAIDARLDARAMPANEAIKLTADIATTRLNDFMVVRQVQGYEMQEQYVTVLLIHARQRLAKVESLQRGLSAKKRAVFDDDWANLKRQILSYEADIEQHGDDVTRLVPWRPVVQEVADLDLVALARAKEEGRLKTFKHTKDGVQVEMLDAQAAIRDILKMHGKFITKVEVKDTTPANYRKLSDSALEEVLHATAPDAE